jgi:hypothetical protein
MDRCCSVELGLSCSQILPADQSPPADCIVMDNREDGLASSSAGCEG